MKKRSVIVTILFLIYLVVVFTVFFNEKKMIAVFASIGAAIYAANIAYCYIRVLSSYR